MNFTFQRIYRGPLQALIFDWAGTMVDYGSQAPAQIFVKVFKDKGIDVTLEEARGPMGMHKRDHIASMCSEPRISKAWGAVHKSLPNQEDIEELFQAFIPLQLDILADYSTLIPGALETFADARQRGLKIGSTTGYFKPPLAGIKNAMNMGVYPFESVVKFDDTTPGITAGLNAGMWTVGFAISGNGVGLNEAEQAALSLDALDAMIEKARMGFVQAGAHYVVDGIWDVPAVLDDIEARLARGERP